MRFPGKKICIDCRHHIINPNGAGNVLCIHPKLNPKNRTEFTGASGHIRGRFETAFQEEMTRNCYSELCEREGKWFESID
jgi:hypothetical protein